MTPNEFYTTTRDTHQVEVNRLKQTGFTLSMLRLAVFVSVSLSIYFLWGSYGIMSGIGAVGLVIFLYLVSHYTDVKNKRNYFQKLVDINQLELDVLDGNLSKLARGEAFIYDDHHYNQDIDLFGEGSLFQLIDRTETVNGQKVLAHWLNANTINNIEEKQEALQELTTKTTWRQNYKATAALVETEVASDSIIRWIKNYKPFVPKAFRFLPLIFSILSLSVFTLYGFGIIPVTSLLIWLMVGIAITSRYIKRVTSLYNSASQMKDTFEQYAKLLDAIETETFTSATLIEQ